MELNILFQHTLNCEDGIIQTVLCAKAGDRLVTICKTDLNTNHLPGVNSRYGYDVGTWYACSNRNISIIEALKEFLGLENKSKNIDPKFEFTHD